MVKAYKHVRDSALNQTPIDLTIQNLVNVILIENIGQDFYLMISRTLPETESFTTKESPGPLFNRNYFGIIEEETREYQGYTYFKISPKEVIEPGMKLQYLTPKSM